MEKFRFYCQKVLPLVYDDSLSYYELLCKVVEQLNRVIANLNHTNDVVTELQLALKELESYVKTYFDSLDVQDAVNKKLDEMAENGYFDRVLIYALWNYDKEEMQDYVNNALKCLHSYLAYSYGTSSIESYVPNNEKVCWEYNTNYGYMGLFGRYSEFKYGEKQTTPAGDLPICYADCSVFTSLITKGITWENSPYYYKIVEKGTDTETLYRKALEYGNIQQYPFTFDWQNNLNTDTMAYIQQKAGIPVLLISDRKTGSGSVLYTQYTSTLATGDIMYRGVSGNNSYKGINHCGTFVKNLSDLVTIPNYQNKIKGIHVMQSNYGYIVEVSGSLDSTKYGDVLRISRLEDWAEYGTGSVQVYSAKPISCTLTSNKANSELTGVIHCYDWDVNVTQERTGDGGYVPVSIVPKQSGGIIIQPNSNLDDFVYDGQYYVPSQAVLDTLTNTPVTNNLYVLDCKGFVKNRSFGVQIAYCYSSTKPRIFIRGKANNSWSAWTQITTA